MQASRLKLVFAVAVAAVLCVGTLTARSADAAKSGGSRASASITLDQADPHLGDWITFSTTGRGSNVQVACYGAGLEIIWSAKQRIGTPFLLGGTDSLWIERGGGSADCYAWLIGKDMSRVYAMTMFTAQGWR